MNQIERTSLSALRALRGSIRLPDPGASAGRPAQSHFAEVGREDELPLAHRLAILYLMAPVAVWLVGWFAWWLGIPAIVAMGLAIRRALSGSWAISVRIESVGLLLVALLWVMMTAAGGVIDVQNFDWDKHRAIFLDLGRGDWPTYIASYFEAPLLLRYYLGYYMVPGLLASWFGPATLNWAVPLWTWSGIALVLALFTRGYRGWRMFVAAFILVFFASFAVPVDHLGVGWGRTMLVDFQFSPQHFIAGALYALLLVQLRRQARFHAMSGVVLATSVFWSPPIAIGLLLFVLAMVIENRLRPFVSWQNAILALPLLGLIAAYMASGAKTIPRGWIWERYAWSELIAGDHIQNLAGFLVFGALLALAHRRLHRDLFFGTLCVAVLVIPWYTFGLLNEYLRYALLVPFVLLCYYCVRTLLDAWQSLHRWFRRGAFALMCLALLCGMGYSFVQLAHVVDREGFNALRYETLPADAASVLDATPAWTHDQYVAAEAPRWFNQLLRSSDTVPLDRGDLIAESAYDVYLNGKELVYVRAPCRPEETETRFILFVYPANMALLEGREHDNMDFWFSWSGKRVGDVCIATRRLPDYTIDRFRTGQYIGTYVPTGVRWEVEHRMKER